MDIKSALDSCSITFPLLDTIFYRFPLKVHPPAVWRVYPPFFGGHFSVNCLPDQSTYRFPLKALFGKVRWSEIARRERGGVKG